LAFYTSGMPLKAQPKMNTKTAATIIGGIYLLQAIGIFFGAGDITSMAFPGVTENDTALNVGTLMHQALAGMAFGTAVIMLFVRQIKVGSAPIFRGFAIGSLGIVGVACFHWATQPVEPPLPLLVTMAGLAIYAWLVAARQSA